MPSSRVAEEGGTASWGAMHLVSKGRAGASTLSGPGGTKSPGRGLGHKSPISGDFGSFGDLIAYKCVMIILIIMTLYK